MVCRSMVGASRLCAFAVALLIAVGWPLTASATKVALLIGNSTYQNVPPLENPRNDVRAIAATLRRIGFDRVTVRENLSFSQSRDALRAFADESSTAEVALLFYAGHGIEVGGQNYLIPTDARLISDRDITFEAIPLDFMLQAVEPSRSLRLVILDACRNNPFAARMTRSLGGSRSVGRGLGYIEPGGTMVVYAAKHGQEAADGAGRNSPFTTALLKNIETPGLDVSFLFRRVRDDVLAATGGRQEPFSYGSLSGEQHYIVPPQVTQPATLPPDVTRWLAIKDSGSLSEVQAYLASFPSGSFAAEARARLAALQPTGPAPAPVAVAVVPRAPQPAATPVPPPVTASVPRDVQPAASAPAATAQEESGFWAWIKRNSANSPGLGRDSDSSGGSPGNDSNGDRPGVD